MLLDHPATVLHNNAVQLHPESRYIISHRNSSVVTPQVHLMTTEAAIANPCYRGTPKPPSLMATLKQAAIATDIIDSEIIDAPAFERSDLFLANNEVMKNDVSHRNPSVANKIEASMATPEATIATPATEEQRPQWPPVTQLLQHTT